MREGVGETYPHARPPPLKILLEGCNNGLISIAVTPPLTGAHPSFRGGPRVGSTWHIRSGRVPRTRPIPTLAGPLGAQPTSLRSHPGDTGSAFSHVCPSRQPLRPLCAQSFTENVVSQAPPSKPVSLVQLPPLSESLTQPGGSPTSSEASSTQF